VIEHVVAAAEHHPRLQDGPFQARAPHELLCCPLRLVVRRAAVRTGPQEAEQGQPASASLLGGPHHIGGAATVNGVVGLGSGLAVDSCTMSHGIAAGEGVGQTLLIPSPSLSASGLVGCGHWQWEMP
jgi:hypothetical protein